MPVEELYQQTLKRFYDICKIPRCSGNEGQIAEWLVQWAKSLSLDVIQDSIGNVIVRVPGKGSLKESPIVILQGHMDMVCVKENDIEHNFCTDPIETYIEEGWLKAKGTTLGADNGIAIAIAMAITENKEIDCPPLELLFTVDEERGLTGANHLEPDVLKGKLLLNLDSEEEGEFTIGCAGGKDTHIELPLEKEELSDCTIIEISIEGLTGGHSGMEINQIRANAIQCIGRALNSLYKELKFNILMIKGGVAHNAIPRDCYAVIAVAKDKTEIALENIAKFKEVLLNEYQRVEKSINFRFEKKEESEEDVNCLAYNDMSTFKVIQLILSIPHGVLFMAEGNKDLVETSNNFAKIYIEEDILKIQTSQRSSIASRNDFITSKIEAVAKLSGAKVESGNGYPSWQPNWESNLLKKCQKAYFKEFNKEAKINVIHAGLECGIIGAKYEGMEMISVGPNIRTPHSPEERMEISSIKNNIAFILALFKEV